MSTRGFYWLLLATSFSWWCGDYILQAAGFSLLEPALAIGFD